MPIRTDDAGKRWIELELLVPGTPEQVWHALATGPGYAGWFVKAEIEPRVGGTLSFDFGGGAISSGEVTKYEPPHQIGYVERDWHAGAPPVATEITITGRAGHCVVRMVHSLFTSSAEWDDQVEGFEKGWPGFFAVLRVYLAHFAGAKAATFMAMQPVAGTAHGVWGTLCESLGLSGASVSERRTATEGHERWSGIVEHVHQDAQQRWVVVRTDEPAAGTILVGVLAGPANPGDLELKAGLGPGTTVSVNRYFYGSDAEARATGSETLWREWLVRTFEAPATVA